MRLLPSWSNLHRMALEKAQVLSGEKNVELERLRGYVRDNRTKLYEGWMRRYLAEILLIIDDQHIAEAQHWIEQAIEADERNEMIFHLGRDHAVYSEVFKKKGDGAKAKEQLDRAMDIYKKCGADGWVKKAEEEMARALITAVPFAQWESDNEVSAVSYGESRRSQAGTCLSAVRYIE